MNGVLEISIPLGHPSYRYGMWKIKADVEHGKIVKASLWERVGEGYGPCGSYDRYIWHKRSTWASDTVCTHCGNYSCGGAMTCVYDRT